MLPRTATQAFPYRLEEKVGEGAMGVVYRATDVSLKRSVAIKILHPGLMSTLNATDTQTIQSRFMQEARAAAALSHPNVTTIYQVGTEAGTPFIVMEWLEGRSLEDILIDQSPLPAQRVARYGVDLLEALAAAHEAGIVHRDIKPANLMVLRNGRLKVADFGIARVSGSRLVKTMAGMMLGTPMFASPEQFLNRPVDGRADIFSAGVVLFVALTGQLPFDGETAEELSVNVLRARPKRLRALNPRVPEGLEAIISRALRRRPDERFHSAREMAEALRPFTLDPAASSPLPMQTTSGAGAAWSSPLTVAPIQAMDLTGLSQDPVAMVASVINEWPSRELGAEDTGRLLDKLLERPLHAPPFAGAVVVGSACLLIGDGVILAAFDVQTRAQGDAVVDAIPEVSRARLYNSVPESDPRLVAVLANVLKPGEALHADLDTSYVNLPALVGKLAAEAFDGCVVLERGAARGIIGLLGGRQRLRLFSLGWDDVPLETPWEDWIADASLTQAIRAHVYGLHVSPVTQSYRRELRDHLVEIQDGAPMPVGVNDAHQTRADVSDASLPSTHVSVVNRATMVHDDPMLRGLGWVMSDVPGFFKERGKTSKWKYLAGWVELVHHARLHHDLPRPETKVTDTFDVVTFDDADKVLHIGQRSATGSKEALEAFVDRVIEAKTARIKTGDVGGAFFFAPAFTPEAIACYTQLINRKVGSGWLYSIQEAMTGYEGFVRIGPRRGFHLLLVQETPDGYVPILPEQ